MTTTEKAARPLPSPELDRGVIRDRLIAEARALGFQRAAVVALDPPGRYPAFLRWLEAGYHGDMGFLARPEHREGRANYDAIVAGARSAVVVAAAYQPSAGNGAIARYAHGQDYHRVVKKALFDLAARLCAMFDTEVVARACVDTAPVLERELAEMAGIGFVGKNTMLISPGLGSYTVLGALFTSAELEPTPPHSMGDRCGACRACLDACPTQAFVAPYVLDARRCVSYLTIEHRGPIAEELRPGIGTRVFGCDVCQDVCPYNRRAPARHRPFPELDGAESPRAEPELADLVCLTTGDYKRLTRGSAMTRASRAMVQRNAAIALGNRGHSSDAEPLRAALAGTDPMVRGAAAWALGRLGHRDELERARASEDDEGVLAEITAALSSLPSES